MSFYDTEQDAMGILEELLSAGYHLCKESNVFQTYVDNKVMIIKGSPMKLKLE